MNQAFNVVKVEKWVAFATFFLVSAFVMVALPASAADYRSPEVHTYEVTKKGRTQTQQGSFLAFDEAQDDGGTVAVGDVNGDGIDEIIVAAGPGSAPVIQVWTGAGEKLSEFMAFPENVNIGLTVASGDLNNNGTDEIVVGTMRGGGPQVRVFNMNGDTKFTPGFFAYDEGFRGGVNVAVGNVDGKGGDEIVTGAGGGGGPHVRVFNKYGKFKGVDFFPFGSNDKGGVSVAVVNVDGGKEEEVVTAIHSFGEPWVKVYKYGVQETILGEFKAYDSSYRGGVMVGGADIDNDGVEEIITGTRQAGGPHIRFFKGHGAVVSGGFNAYEEDFRGGVSVAAGNIDGDSKTEVVTMPMKKIVEGRLDVFKYIEVDLATQTLRAYRNGVKENEFLISSGIDKYPSPEGEFRILAKLPTHDYQWSYGPEHPDNYDLKNVANNLRFNGHYYFHYAYWHNNFGHKMSNGCININEENSQWLYDWADVGDKVYVY